MKTPPEKLCSILITSMGLCIMVGWLVDQSILKSFNPNFIVTVFNTALCFTIAGVASLLPESKPLLCHQAQRIVGTILILFAGSVLLQDIMGISLGIDELFVTVKVDDYNPNPGRMAPPTALSFILCGVVSILLNCRRNKAINLVIQTSILLVMMLAVVGAAGAAIRLELLYDWYKYSRMAIPTAMGFILLSGVLWIAWYKKESKEGSYLEKAEKRISIVGIIIITAVAIAAGMSGFGVLANQMQHTLELSLKETYNNHVNLIQSEFEQSLSATAPVTTRILLNRYLSVFNTDPSTPKVRAIIGEDAATFLAHDFSAIAIYARNGELITEAGQFTKTPDLAYSLKSKDSTRQLKLLWKNGAILQIKMDIAPNGEKIGSAFIEKKLPYINRLLLEKSLLGETAETRICYALNESEMQCLPDSAHPEMFPVEPQIRQRNITSMYYALRAESGIRIFHDYHDHQAVSAYGPIGDVGLGMVVKIDTAEFYGPIRERLEYVIGLIIILACLGIFIQRLQIVPLVKRLVRSEERVRSINRFQQALLDSARFTIIACDDQGIIKIFNKSAERMLGYSADEVIGKVTPGIFHDRELIKKRSIELTAELGYEIKPGIETFLAKPRIHGSEESEWVYISKEGTRYPILLSVSCLRNDAGEVIGSLAIGVDITERKRLERLKNEFISTVSHELRTPLTSIRGSLGLMKAGVVGELPPKAKEMTDIAYNNAERLILLINDILDIDKIESGEMRFDIKEYDLNTLVNQAMESNAPYAQRFNIHFHVEPLATGVLVSVDSNRFIQVLSNLLSNAAKFSAPGSEVRIEITQKNQTLRVAISDTGAGIPEEFHSRIFSKFAQADSSSSRHQGGSGLGLNISKTMIEQMNGKIGFISKVGQGTTFWIELPQSAHHDSPAVFQDAIDYLDQHQITDLPRILHAEDDYDFCRIISHLLQGKAIVHVAATVADASSLLKSNAYQLLILDLSLPDGSGLHLLKKLQEEGRATKVMLLSASEVNDKVRGMVDLALVKSRVSEDKIIDDILMLLAHQIK